MRIIQKLLENVFTHKAKIKSHPNMAFGLGHVSLSTGIIHCQLYKMVAQDHCFLNIHLLKREKHSQAFETST